MDTPREPSTDFLTLISEASKGDNRGDYYAYPAISASALKLFVEHPLAYYKFSIGEKTDLAPSRVRMGNLIHTFNEDPTKVLIEKIPTGMMYDMCEYIKNNQTSLNCVTNADGEDIILDLAASKAGYVRRTSAIEQYKALWKDSVFMNGAKEGELHCSQSDYDLLTIWKERIRRSPASRFLDNSYEKEKEFYVRYGDVELKSKMDASKCVKRDSIHEIADWKSCVSLSDFKQNFFKYGYHIQDALYRLVFSVANDVPLHAVNFYFVALSKTPPYPVQVFKSSEIYDIEALLKRLMKHIQTNQWEFTLEENEYGYSKL